MRHEILSYQADGLRMRSQLFHMPSTCPRAAVLVFPDAMGLGEHAIERAKRLAALGYVTLACDLHGEGRFVDDLPEAMKLLQPLFDDPSKTQKRASAALQMLISRPEVNADRVGAIGFCFPMPLELARSGAKLRAVVGFHTGLLTNAPQPVVGSITARILVCIGAEDPFIPPTHRSQFESEMRAADANWRIHLYGRTAHSFTNKDAANRNMPDAIRYSPEADASSWKSMLELFAESLHASPALSTQYA